LQDWAENLPGDTRAKERHMHKTGMILASAAILAGTVLAGVAGSAGAAGGQLVVQGQVTEHGKPIAGTTVQLYAMPRQSVIAALKIGQRVPEVLLATATTNSAGR
jgi:hypothetical protein